MKFLTIFIFSAFAVAGHAQEKGISEQEIINKLSFIKQENKNREIIFKENLFYDFKEEKSINPAGLTKDSLRHFLVSHGFYDFNFGYFQIKVKNPEELNELNIKKNHPDFYNLLSDSLYNKVTFNFKEVNDGVLVDAIISQNFIEIDKVNGEAVIGTGYIRNDLTYGGTSRIDNIFYVRTDNYKNSISNKINKNKQPLQLNKEKRFNITVDVRSHKSIYTTITNDTGNILSIIKMF
ncbi:MAG: hypothetical protein K0B11_15790 [Mariniphaga sp.]|nr:hypothetical protein [Mariniphaga sp.]